MLCRSRILVFQFVVFEEHTLEQSRTISDDSPPLLGPKKPTMYVPRENEELLYPVTVTGRLRLLIHSPAAHCLHTNCGVVRPPGTLPTQFPERTQHPYFASCSDRAASLFQKLVLSARRRVTSLAAAAATFPRSQQRRSQAAIIVVVLIIFCCGSLTHSAGRVTAAGGRRKPCC